jgi:membrane-bound lytic murein transglycosylase B
MTHTQREETTPDQLLDTFRGSSLKSIIAVTVIVHAVILLGTSVPYLMETFTGSDTSKLGEKERLDIATQQATTAMREIAAKHGITPEQLGERFAPRAPVGAVKETTTPESETKTPESTTPDGAAPETKAPEGTTLPENAIEKEINVKKDGPTVPTIDPEKDDLFK